MAGMWLLEPKSGSGGKQSEQASVVGYPVVKLIKLDITVLTEVDVFTRPFLDACLV